MALDQFKALFNSTSNPVDLNTSNTLILLNTGEFKHFKNILSENSLGF